MKLPGFTAEASLCQTARHYYPPARSWSNIIWQELHVRRAGILHIAVQHGAYNVRVFGSVARREARSDSDIDFLVDRGPGGKTVDRLGLARHLATMLGWKVHVNIEADVSPPVRRTAMRDAIPL